MSENNKLPDEHYLSLIREHFPEISFSSAQRFSGGWEHEVFLLDTGVLFRFPKVERVKDQFKREVALLERIGPRLLALVPHYTFLPKDRSFGGYPAITGTELTKEIMLALGAEQREVLAKEVGNFFTALHSTPLALVADLELEQGFYFSSQSIERRWGVMKEIVYPKLAFNEKHWLDAKFSRLLELSSKGEHVLVHGDFTSGNAFIDTTSGKLTGVIDFGDSECDDPATDFNGLLRLDERFARQVLAHYDRPVNDTFMERALLPSLVHHADHMREIIKGADIPVTWEEAHDDLREVMIKYP